MSRFINKIRRKALLSYHPNSYYLEQYTLLIIMITLKDIAAIITKSLPKNSFSLQLEIRQPKISNGHMYLTLKDSYGQIPAIIWKNKMNDNIRQIKDGELVDISCIIEYYPLRGSLNLVINKIEPLNNTGNLYKEYEAMKLEFEEKGYFNNKIDIPNVIKNILIISSKTGAAIQDFYYALSDSNVTHTLIDCAVQGNECPNQICAALNTDMSLYDLIVITRGGGSMEDLWGFNNRKLIETINQLKSVHGKPVLSAIGHMVDTTLLDLVADVVAPTPSLAAQYIVDHNNNYIERLLEIKTKYLTIVNQTINQHLTKLDNYDQIKYRIIETMKNHIVNTKSSLINYINMQLSKFDLFQSKYNNDNVTIYSKNKQLSSDTFSNIISKKKPFIIVWNGQVYTIQNYDINKE